MNILYVSNISGNKFAGTSVIIPKIIKEQKKKNYVYWINMNERINPEWNDCADVFYNRTSLPKDFISRIASKSIEVDIIVVHEVYVYGFSPLLKKILQLGIPYVIVPHSQLTKEAQKQKRVKKLIANYLFYNKIIKGSARIQYLSEGERASSMQLFKTRNYVIPNGITAKINQPIHSVPDFKINCVFIGRIDIYQKGLDLLIEAISLIKNNLLKVGFKLNIYGPSFEDSKKKLQSSIKQLGVEEVISIYDPVYDQEKERVLESADCFILTSRFEGHPVGLIEALSFGIPCLVSTGTYMDKAIEEYKAGWVCSCDAESISVALKSLVRDVVRFPEFSRNAFMLAKKYDWDVISNNNEIELLKIIGDKNG